MRIQELQQKTDEWISTYGVRYFNELTNMTVLTEEVGELARLMARTYGEQSFKKPVPKEELKGMIADELSDILFVVTCLANQMNIDLEQAMIKNFEKKTSRDSKRHLTNDNLNSDQ